MFNQIILTQTDSNVQIDMNNIISVGTGSGKHWIVDDNGNRFEITQSMYFRVLLVVSEEADYDQTVEAASVYGQRM